MAGWKTRVTNALISDSATHLKEQSDKLGRALVEKFAPVVANNVGIRFTVPKGKKGSVKYEDPTVRLLKSIGGAASGFLGDILSGEVEVK